ncbi:glycosyltransferase 61 family protein [Azospirillum sp. sgz301742]
MTGSASSSADGADAPRPDVAAVEKTLALALALHESGWLDKAAETYRAVLHAQPRHVGAMHLLGLVHYEQGNLPEAITLLRAALAIDGTVVRCHIALASAFSSSCDVVMATDSFKRAIALEPANAESLRLFGALLRWDKRFGEAVALFRRAMSIRKNDPALLHQTAAVLLDTGEATAAEHCLHKALSLEDDNPNLNVTLGKALSAQGRPEDALAAYENAVALRHDNLEGHFGVTAALEALGRRDEAAQRLYAASGVINDTDALPRIFRKLFDLGDADAATAVYRRFLGVTTDRKRFPGAELRHLTIRPVAEVCRALGWPYHQVAPPRPCRLVTDDNREHFLSLPEAFLARADDAEIVPLNYAVIADGDSLLLDGLNTSSRVSLTMMPHVVAHAPDDRMLLDLAVPAYTIGEEAILLGGGPNWSHGVLDWTSKLAVLEHFPNLDGLPILVAPDMLGSILDLMALMGVERERIRRLPAGESVRARRLWIPSLTHIYQFNAPLHLESLRRRLAGPIAEGMARPRRRIFLSRRKAGYRTLVNEAEVLAALAPLGVEAVVAEDLSMAEQIALFASAELIVGPIGGGSAAVAFAPPGAAYVELVHRRIAIPQYGILTAMLGQRYRQIVGPMRGNRGPSEFDYDFAVSPDTVAAAVRGLLDGAGG